MKANPRTAPPFIGVTPDVNTKPNGSPYLPQEPITFLANRYTEGLSACGAIPLILPVLSSRRAIDQMLLRMDGILVTGGNFDIDPKYYGEEPRAGLGEIKEERSRFELELISVCIERDLPLLGVCGGEQAINVALGGSLYQDIRTDLPHCLDHQLSALRDQGGHLVQVHAGTKLHQLVGQDRLNVNTTHHQAVKKLGHGLIVNATSEDGVIEGIEGRDHSFLIGLQWHPELLIQKEPAQQRIIRAFVSACRAGRHSPR